MIGGPKAKPLVIVSDPRIEPHSHTFKKTAVSKDNRAIPIRREKHGRVYKETLSFICDQLDVEAMQIASHYSKTGVQGDCVFCILGVRHQQLCGLTTDQ